MVRRVYIVAIILLFSVFASVNGQVLAAKTIIFPLIGNGQFYNDFTEIHNGVVHNAIDILAPKGTPLVAAASGTIDYVNSPQPSWGYSVGIKDADGYEYNYLHMNDDNPGTNDGQGGEMHAYAPDMKKGNHVEAGQLLGWVGDSGHSNGVSHLHFEMYAPDGSVMNPYTYLTQAPHTPSPSLYPPLTGETLPYWVQYGGGLNLAMGDFNNDGVSETATAAGAGGGPHIKTYASNNTYLGEFFAYDQGFKGGVDIALGDTNGDGVDEIITGPGPGGGPWVRVFNTQAQLLSEFAAYDPGFTGGIHVAAGDVNGDGKAEIITGPQAGGGPWVRVFDASNAQLISQFAAYDPGFKGGIDVAAGNTTGSINDEIITGPGAGGGPWIRVFSASTGQSVLDAQVYDQNFKGGVRVSAGNVRTANPTDEIMTIPSDYGESRVRLLSSSGANITDYPYLETWWRGYYDVAAGHGTSRVGTGTNRRASMRNGPN